MSERNEPDKADVPPIRSYVTDDLWLLDFARYLYRGEAWPR